MKSLYKQSTETKLLSTQLQIANSFWPRMKGLLGTSQLKKEQMLWIHTCNSIHTFFMRYPIDCVFLDEHLTVRAIKKQILPWRATFPVISAISVIEMGAGQAEELGLTVGDQLYVGP